MNIVGLVGKISTEIQLKVVGSSKVANFILSVPSAGKWNSAKGEANHGTFVIEAWGKTAERLFKFCDKGTTISLSGALKQDSWADQSGNLKDRVKVVINSFEFSSVSLENFTSLAEEEDDNEQYDYDPFAL